MDIWRLYELMVKSRLYEEAIQKLWNDGKISGEMHMGLGEEAIIVGIVSQLIEGDSLALDHRGTAALLTHGIDPVTLLLELLGHEKGLCRGYGGHMHLFSKEHLSASSGIVGSSGPAAVGFALAAQYKKSNNIAVAFFGEGSVNQGMMMESFKLASAWNLTILLVCKDNYLAISTVSPEVTGGSLLDRAKGFGMNGAEIDGKDIFTVWTTANEAIEKVRRGDGPFFLQAKCEHKEGHFLGDPLLRFYDNTIEEFSKVTGGLVKATINLRGARLDKRLSGLGKILGLIRKSGKQRKNKVDPWEIAKSQIEELKNNPEKLTQIKNAVEKEINLILEQTMKIMEGRD